MSAGFGHEQHVELAFRHLQETELDLGEAVIRMERAIRKIARDAGAPDKYHATITWAYCTLIAERMRMSPSCDWQAFKAANPDVFEPGLALLLRYYTRERLMSETARQQFVLPARWR